MDRDTLRARLTDDTLWRAIDVHNYDAMRTILLDALCPPTPERDLAERRLDRLVESVSKLGATANGGRHPRMVPEPEPPPIAAHSQSEFRRLTAMGANVVPPADPRCSSIGPTGVRCVRRSGHESHHTGGGEAWIPDEPPRAPRLTVEALALEVADLFDAFGLTVRGGRLRDAAKAAQEPRS